MRTGNAWTNSEVRQRFFDRRAHLRTTTLSEFVTLSLSKGLLRRSVFQQRIEPEIPRQARDDRALADGGSVKTRPDGRRKAEGEVRNQRAVSALLFSVPLCLSGESGLLASPPLYALKNFGTYRLSYSRAARFLSSATIGCGNRPSPSTARATAPRAIFRYSGV